MTFLPFKVKNPTHSSNIHFISSNVEPQAVEQHIFSGLLQLKIKSGKHFIKCRWCMATNSCNLISSRVWPDDGSQYAIITFFKNTCKYAFCITWYQISSEWSWLGNLQIITVMWWIPEILMRVSGAWRHIAWRHRGCWFTEPWWWVHEWFAPMPPLSKEGCATAPGEAQSDTLV